MRRPARHDGRLVLGGVLLISALVLGSVGGSPAEAQPAPEAAAQGITQISSNGVHNCARTNAGGARCWGSNYDGEQGDGTDGDEGVPIGTVLAPTGSNPLANVASVAVGFYNSCALLTSGQVRCWGFNGDGQVGTGGAADYLRRAKIVSNPQGTGPLTGVTQLTAGERHTCALLENHQVRCWGANQYGQVGDGTHGNQRRRPRVVLNPSGTGPLQGVTQIDAGHETTCGRLTTGQVRCWGRNESGELGTGGILDRDLPVRVTTGPNQPLTNVRQVSAGKAFACAVLDSGQARCWGLDTGRQDGNEDVNGTAARRAHAVLEEAGNRRLRGVTQLDAGGEHACARLRSGEVRCWGEGDAGQLGDDFAGSSDRPVAVLDVDGIGSLTHVSHVRTGSEHSCARLTTGRIACWGGNDIRQLGDLTEDQRNRPVLVQEPA